MADNDPVAGTQVVRNEGCPDGGTRRGQDCVARCRIENLAEQLMFDGHALGAVLLNQIGFCDHICQRVAPTMPGSSVDRSLPLLPA